MKLFGINSPKCTNASLFVPVHDCVNQCRTWSRVQHLQQCNLKCKQLQNDHSPKKCVHAFTRRGGEDTAESEEGEGDGGGGEGVTC